MSIVPNESSNTNFPNSVATPWSIVPNPYMDRAYFAFLNNPGTPGSYQAMFGTTGSGIYCSSGVAFVSVAGGTLTLSLSDAVSASDVMADSFSIPLSDSVTSSDHAPQSFSVQSDFILPTAIPTVETLVNQLVPSSVKTYFKIQE
jgi:hypothetical protein